MEKGIILERLIKEQGSIRAFAKKCNIPDSTLRSILKNVGGASVDTVITICKNLDITIEELDCMSKGIPFKGSSYDDLQTLIKKRRGFLTIEEKNALIKSILEEDSFQKTKDA